MKVETVNSPMTGTVKKDMSLEGADLILETEYPRPVPKPPSPALGRSHQPVSVEVSQFLHRSLDQGDFHREEWGAPPLLFTSSSSAAFKGGQEQDGGPAGNGGFASPAKREPLPGSLNTKELLVWGVSASWPGAAASPPRASHSPLLGAEEPELHRVGTIWHLLQFPCLATGWQVSLLQCSL